ncbi:MAG: triose-phosphate isomerase [Pseudomonadota bacterium]|nr:triose-phosphate isomerase [Pseudomonadota bacterium]
MIIAANWKMNLSREQALHHLTRSSQLYVHHAPGHQSVFFVPACYFGMAEEILSSAGAIGWGGQDCHQDEAGAFTGDISADMLLGFGCGWALIGHSERRQYHFETDRQIAHKTAHALKKGLRVVLCVGESLADRQAGNNDAVISGQLDTVLVYLAEQSVSTANLVIAYEPVWAIGTGNVASLAQIDDMHGHIRDVLDSAAQAGTDNPILYGGSVNETNGAEIFSLGSVGGALVGGASLDAEKFASLCTISQQK